MEYMIVLFSALIIIGSGVITFLVLKKKLNQESTDIEKNQAILLEEAKRKAETLSRKPNLKPRAVFLK